MRRYLLAVVAASLLASCAALDAVIPVFDPATGDQVGTTTVGDAAATALEEASPGIVGAVETLATGASANPVIGLGAGAAMLSLLAAGAGALRKKKKVG